MQKIVPLNNRTENRRQKQQFFFPLRLKFFHDFRQVYFGFCDEFSDGAFCNSHRFCNFYFRYFQVFELEICFRLSVSKQTFKLSFSLGKFCPAFSFRLPFTNFRFTFIYSVNNISVRVGKLETFFFEHIQRYMPPRFLALDFLFVFLKLFKRRRNFFRHFDFFRVPVGELIFYNTMQPLLQINL